MIYIIAKPKLYAAYGSSLHRFTMTQRCPKANIVGSSELMDYMLLFRGPNGSATATIEPHSGTKVPVIIWELTASDEDSLDKYKDSSLFRKETVNIKLGRKAIQAMTFIMNTDIMTPPGCPSTDYYDTIFEAYMDSNFNLRILIYALLRSFIMKGETQ